MSTVEEFAEGQDVTTVRKVLPHLHAEALNRLRQALFERRPYDGLNWNCEIFANWLTGEQPVSEQVRGVVVAAFIAGVLLLGAGT
ncbi:MAG: hypothetical protein WBX11_02010 [Thiobacillaceae bacterium]